VTGGTPYGFNVGIKPGSPGGPFIEAMNQGIVGMGVGTVRTMIGAWLTSLTSTQAASLRSPSTRLCLRTTPDATR
jgi:hypothetical protein